MPHLKSTIDTGVHFYYIVVAKIYYLANHFIKLVLNCILIVIKKEMCPIKGASTKSQEFNCNGGELFIKEHAVKITIPAGAIIEGHVVQFEAAAGPLGAYSIPEGYHPISVYVLLQASYLFRKKLKIEIEHDVVVSQDMDTSMLRVLTTGKEVSYFGKDGQKWLEMHEDTCEYQYEVNGSTCTLFADHFCSKCLASIDTVKIPKRVMIYHYLPEDYKSETECVSDICICYDLTFCKQVCSCPCDIALYIYLRTCRLYLFIILKHQSLHC